MMLSLAGTSTYVWSWRIGGRIGQAESRPQFLSWTRWLVRPASRRPAGGTWRPLSRCDAPPRMTVSTSRRIEESPRHWTTAAHSPALQAVPAGAPLSLNIGSVQVHAGSVRGMYRQPTRNRESARADGQGRAVFAGPLPSTEAFDARAVERTLGPQIRPLPPRTGANPSASHADERSSGRQEVLKPGREPRRLNRHVLRAFA
jgi:hypothetical protein